MAESLTSARDVARTLAGEVERGQSRQLALRDLLDRFSVALGNSVNPALISQALTDAGLSVSPPLDKVTTVDTQLTFSSNGASSPGASSPGASASDAAPGQRKAMTIPPGLPLGEMLAYAQAVTVSIFVDDGFGSGFIVDGDAGIILTARHVVEDGRAVKVRFHNGTQVDALVLMSHVTLDYAFVQVEPTPYAFELNSGAEPYMGQRVYAIGSPLSESLEGSVTSGIISATSRVNNGVRYLQTDTTINRGNSGGPLLSEAGLVVGMNVWGRADAAGYNFAVPASYLVEALEELRTSLGRAKELVYCAPCGMINDGLSILRGTNFYYCARCGTMIGSWSENKESTS